MFKWLCLAMATVFLSLAAWMLNDIRVQLRESAERVRTAAETVNAELPTIVDRTRATSEVVSKNLPRVVQRIDRTTETLAELAEDIRQLKQLAGMTGKRDESLVAYTTSALDAIGKSGGVIGTGKVVGGGLKNTRPAAEWVVGARKEALFWLVLVRSKREMAEKLGKTNLGLNWFIQLPGKEPIPLLTWIKANHPESKDL